MIPAQARSKPRTRQRGTAMVEAVISITAFIPIFAGIVYFQATYSAKIMSMQNTRAYSWAYALGGCNKVPDDATLGVLSNFGSPQPVTDTDDTNVQQELGDTGNSVPNTGTEIDNDPTYTENVFGTGGGASGAKVGTVKATSSVQMKSFNVLGIEGKVMTSSTDVQCAPTPKSGSDIGGTIITIARNLVNW